jgi:hypothetical protein
MSTVTIDAQELEIAVDFVSAGAEVDACAYVCRETGKIYWLSSDHQDDDLPEDLDDATRYLPVPSKNDLDLGRRLVLDYVAEALPDDYDTVAGYFRRRGAYRAFRALLEARGKLDEWYAFANRATDAALRDWCAEHDLQLAPRAR